MCIGNWGIFVRIFRIFMSNYYRNNPQDNIQHKDWLLSWKFYIEYMSDNKLNLDNYYKMKGIQCKIWLYFP
jgi:hypothetical protein